MCTSCVDLIFKSCKRHLSLLKKKPSCLHPFTLFSMPYNVKIDNNVHTIYKKWPRIKLAFHHHIFIHKKINIDPSSTKNYIAWPLYLIKIDSLLDLLLLVVVCLDILNMQKNKQLMFIANQTWFIFLVLDFLLGILDVLDLLKLDAIHFY
jgi:hypothetical protein